MHVCEAIFMYVCETIYLCMCVKLCERYVVLWIMFAKTLWNEEMTKIKVVDLDEFYNFYIHHLFRWNRLVFENLVRSCYFMKFKIWIVQIKWNEKMNKLIAVRTQEMVAAWF